MSIEAARRLGESVEGFLTDKEGELLYKLARGCKGEGVIVEIGSFKGKSTIWLAMGSKSGSNVTIYAVDPHTGSPEHNVGGRTTWTYEDFIRNIREAQVDNTIVPCVETSESFAKKLDQPVEFIFIDGAHEYEAVKQDFELWFPKVLFGGVMAFHDTTLWEGPRKVVAEHVFRSRKFKNVRFVHSTTYAEKVEHNTLTDCIRNRVVLAIKTAHEARFLRRLPTPLKAIGQAIGRYILRRLE